MASRNQREGWYAGKGYPDLTVRRHFRMMRGLSLRGDPLAEVVSKNNSGVVENAELLENFPMEVKGLELLQEVMDEVAKNKKGRS